MQLQDAYRSTTYRVYSEKNGDVDILIGQSNLEIDAILKSNQAKSYAFITAWNPSANQELEKLIGNFTYCKGFGIPSNEKDWKGEESFFVMDITKQESSRLGILFKQNAIVFGCINNAPELIMLV
jgi:hypothetical protein